MKGKSVHLKFSIMHPLFRILLDVLFPRACVGCKQEGTYLCIQCENFISPKVEIQTHDELRIFSCFTYEEGKPLAKLIHLWKYRFVTDVESYLDRFLSKVFSNAGDETKEFLRNALLCPVPLHKKRHGWRGFNQAEHFAHILSQNMKKLWNFEIPVGQLLSRKINTPPQVDLPREKRLMNVVDAFEISQKNLDASLKKIILIDDIVTTGTTLHECAKVLKKYFPKTDIRAAVLATPPSQ